MYIDNRGPMKKTAQQHYLKNIREEEDAKDPTEKFGNKLKGESLCQSEEFQMLKNYPDLERSV